MFDDTGVPHLSGSDTPPQGGKPGWAVPPNPRIGPWLRLLKKIAEDRGLVPEFEVRFFFCHQMPNSVLDSNFEDSLRPSGFILQKQNYKR